MMHYVEWVMENWTLIIMLLALAISVGVAIVKFLNLPSEKQIDKIKKCLLGWVIDAERDLGGGTGKVKLSTVYGMFVTAFPFIKNFVTFETFSDWVDEALDTMRAMLESNKSLKQIVEGNVLISEETITAEYSSMTKDIDEEEDMQGYQE